MQNSKFNVAASFAYFLAVVFGALWGTTAFQVAKSACAKDPTPPPMIVSTSPAVGTFPPDGKLMAAAEVTTEGRWLPPFEASTLLPVQFEARKFAAGGSQIKIFANPGTIVGCYFIPEDDSEDSVLVRFVLAGVSPKPPPDDVDDTDDPDVQADGIVSVIMLRSPEASDEDSADEAEVMINIGDWVDEADPDKVQRFTLDYETQTQYESLVDGEYPYVIVTQDTDKGNAIVRWKGELPDSAEAIVREVEKCLQ